MGFFANADLPVLLAFLLYLAVMLGIGFYFTNKSKKMSDYFLAGRGLNSWVTAMSAQASDMSGWLLMGLPGAAYATGMGNYWIAIGLAIGTILNWAFVAKPLRRFTEVCGDSITIPQYLQNRFKTDSPVVRMVCAVVIFIFFLVYTTSAFVSGGKLFQVVFNIDPTNETYTKAAVIISALIIIIYTFLGGFNAVAWTDFVQGMLMVITIVALPIALISNTPGFSSEMLNSIPKIVSEGGDTSGYMSMVSGMRPVDIISNLAWAFGYFGMPHILVRFMAIEDEKKLTFSRRIASVWVVIAMTVGIFIGVVGLAMTKAGSLENLADSETVIVRITGLISRHGVIAALIAGVILAGILAATMSTSDSQLLTAASGVSQNILHDFFHIEMDEKKSLLTARLTIVAIAVVAVFMARNPNSSVFGIVSFAWAGFGAAFGAVMLCALFWKRSTLAGAISGMVAGGVMVFVWKYLVRPLGGAFDIYELLPAFLVSLVVIVVVSFLTQKPSEEVLAEFDKAAEK